MVFDYFVLRATTFTRGGMGVAVGGGGVALRRTLQRIRGRSSCLVTFGRSGLRGAGHIGLGVGTRSLSGALTSVLSKAKLSCGVGSGCVVVVPRSGIRIRDGGLSKVIGSSGKSPLVKIGVSFGNDPAKAIANLSKQFSVLTTGKGVVRFSCMNCAARCVAINSTSSLAIMLRRSTGTLSRMIIATLNVGHTRGTLDCDIRRMGSSTVGSIGSTGFIGKLAKGITNMSVGQDSSNVNKTAHIIVHKTGSVMKGGGILCIISNVPVNGPSGNRVGGSCDAPKKNRNVSSFGPRSVRDLSVLANPTTTTLCNSSTTGNIVLVGAGGKRRNGLGVSVSGGARFVAPCMVPRFRGQCNGTGKSCGD